MTPLSEKPPSNSQRAYQALRDMIFSGELAPGSDHLESEMASRLGVSRTPVREAALMLESQGLLELRPRKGVRILPVSPDDMAEIYDVLTELECLAARSAAEKRLTDKSLQTLTNAIESMELAVSAGDLEQWAQSDDAFHRELVRLGGNSRVTAIFEMMNDQVRRARAVTLFMRDMPVQSNEDHRQVYEAIKAGDAKRAGEVHRSHRQNAKQMMLDLLQKHRLLSV
ncbi:transcriptional regulator, GntR family protein [Roseobacter sp. MED193]|uniref:GntR family transcriptional regulator n=1 Tax=Roseobacter sp. MED193 TaxID=314262 RepID=UPI000068A20D|nr:GntR family transcriptional regulator [Roseobacter sp. MED193]EAQ45343.1 transcriptional regulator, GntR family protein [Roseobacter sp. MED193]